MHLRLLCLFFLMATTTFSQINVGSLKNPDRRSGGGELRRNDIRSLQRTKTIFFHGQQDSVSLEKMKKAIKEAWTITELEFDDIANFNSYEKQRNVSYITLELQAVEKLNTNLGTTKTIGYRAFYHLWIPGNRGEESFARIELFLDFETEAKMLKMEDEKERMKFLYSSLKAYNWNAGFAKIYFSFVNAYLTQEKSFGLYTTLTEQDSVSSLANTTLYVPGYVLAVRDPRSYEISYEPAVELFDKYPFPYEVKKTEELGEMLYNDKGYFRFLLYVLAGDEKHISVFDSNGNLLYHEFSGNSYRLEDKDLKKLAKTID